MVFQHCFVINARDRHREISSRMERILDLRNRIAHHEHIFGRQIDKDMSDALFLAEAAAPGIADWLVTVISVASILETDPRGRPSS